MIFPTSSTPSLEIESQLGFPHRDILGFDEVGRGCIAGPVLAGVAVLPLHLDINHPLWEPLNKVKDSKLLSEKERENLFPYLQKYLKAWAVGQASVEEIEKWNILKASQIAMRRALDQLNLGAFEKPVAIVDGNLIPKVLVEKIETHAFVKGDQRSFSIACASVLAKVTRDRMMEKWDHDFPGYGFKDHKGYGTPKHKGMLNSLGPCSLHRKSFAPVKNWGLKSAPM